MKPPVPASGPVDPGRRTFLGVAAAAPLAAVAPTVADAAGTSAAPAPDASRYRDTEHVRTYYRLAEY